MKRTHWQMTLTFLFFISSTFPSKPTFTLSTDPQGAQVWVNGALVGTTPLEISSRQIQNLDIRLNGYFEVAAEDLTVETDQLTIDLLPFGIDSAIFYQYPILDWRYVAFNIDGDLSLVNLADRSKDQIIWPYTDPFTQPNGIGEVPYSPVISPNGDLITYLTSPRVAPKCVYSNEQIWLSSLSNTEQRISLLDHANAEIPGCSDAHGFSPDQEFVWMKADESGYTGQYSLMVLPLGRKDPHWQLLNSVFQYSPVVWSMDGRRVAFLTQEEEPVVYRRQGFGLKENPVSLAGTPLTWSFTNYGLWLIEDRRGIDSSTLTLVDATTNTVLQTIDITFDFGSFRTLVWNSTGSKFAVVVQASNIRNTRKPPLNYLLIVDVVTGKATQIPSNLFEFPLFWLDDGNKLALLMNAKDLQDETEPIVRIISIP